jgi:hypothetical protein
MPRYVVLERVMNSTEKAHQDADSSVNSALRRLPVFSISKPLPSKFITASSELDRARCQKRQGDTPAYRQRQRSRREARVEVGAGLLDRRSLRHGLHLRGTGRRSLERPSPRDRLFGQRANHHAPSLQRGRDVGDTLEARLRLSTSENRRGELPRRPTLRRCVNKTLPGSIMGKKAGTSGLSSLGNRGGG